MFSVKSVRLINLNKLYEACITKDSNKSQGDRDSYFGPRFVEFLNHVEITFMLKNVTGIDMHLLKTLTCGRCSKLSNMTDVSNSGESSLKKYIALNNSIIEDDEVKLHDKNNYMQYCGPNNVYAGEMSVTFTGNTLMFLLPLNSSNFFSTITNKGCIDENGALKDDIDFSSNADLKKYSVPLNLAKLFIEKFRKYAEESISMVDAYSDSMIFKHFSNHDDAHMIKISLLKNPCMKVDFETDSYKKCLAIIDRYGIEAPQYIKDSLLTLTYMEFKIYSDMSVFLYLRNELPNHMFITVEDIKIPYKNRECFIPDEFGAYSIRLKSRYEDIEKYVSDSKDIIEKTEYTYNHSKISYILNISFDEVNRYIIPLMNNDVASRNNSIKTIIRTIVDKAKFCYKLF